MNASKDQKNTLIRTYRDLGNALTKTVSVEIDGDMLDELKKNEYKICFAKKVGNFDYNVVWQSYDQYMERNEFSWLPQYSVFGSNQFKDTVKVSVSCKPVTIGLGEMTTLSKSGRLSKAVTGGKETALTIHNEFGSIHPGVDQLSVGLDGEQVSTPIYVAQKASVSGDIELTPVEKVLVWFEQDIETATMFSTSRSKSKEVDLTDDNEVHLRYDKGGIWKIV